MGLICDMHGRDEPCVKDSGRKHCRREHLDHLGVDCRIILKLIIAV
jgi:hypothetical protein